MIADDVLTDFGSGLMCRTAVGTGDKVLWIHGYTMDSSLWSELWHHLPGFHHIGIDLPYHGAAQAPSEAFTMPDFARMIGELALSQGVKHVIGLSLGAVLALQVATELPDAFKTITLGSASLSHGPNDPQAGPHYWRVIALLQQRGVGPWLTKQWMQYPPDIFKGAANHPELWQRLEQVIDRHSWAEMKVPFMTKLTQYRQIDNMDRIAAIQSPTLLIVGDDEMPAFKHAASMLQQTLPNCRCEYLPNAGHLCLLEQPLASARLIEEFLSHEH